MTDSISGQDLGGRERVGISSSLIYNQRPAAVLARKIQYVGQANNQTYAPGGLIRMEIPTSPGTFLQCGTTTLKFDFNISTTAAAAAAPTVGAPWLGSCCFDSTAASLIRRIRVYSGSSLIEDIGEYSKIYELMKDATASSAEDETTGSIEGYPNVELAQADTLPNVLLACQNVRRQNTSRDYLQRTVGNNAAVDDVAYQFEIPLMSGTIGTMCPKWFPLGAAGAAPLRVEVELNSNNSGVIQTTLSASAGGAGGSPITWDVRNVEIHCDIVQLDNNAMRLVDESVNGQYVVNTSSFRHSVANIAAGVNSSNTILPFRFSSCKAFLSRLYSQASQITLASNSQTGANRAGCSEYFHQIGSSHVPANNVRLGASAQTGVTGVAGLLSTHRQWKQGAVEGVTELMKAVHGKNILQVSNKINSTNWNRTDTPIIGGALGTTDAVNRGTFTFAVDLESQGKASELIENGTSSVSLLCMLSTTHDVVTPSAQVLHSWCMHDLRLEYVGGVCIARF
jgi:hypothetical protein